MTTLREPILPDDAPVFRGYRYIVDGKLVIMGRGFETVGAYRRKHGNPEFRKCDLAGRGELAEAGEGVLTVGRTRYDVRKSHKSKSSIKPRLVVPNGDEFEGDHGA